jgi:predicted nucleic acid-binding protein
MSVWIVDTNVILDIIGGDPNFGEKSSEIISRYSRTGILVINPIIYGEVGALLSSIEELNSLLPTSLFHRYPIPWEASFTAGQAFAKYKRQGGKKNRILADFLIGAHATAIGAGIISRDKGYSKYFSVQILNPSEK